MWFLSLPRWVYAVVAVVVFILATYFYGHHKGWTERDAEMQAEIVRLNEQSREIERTMNSKLVATTTRLQEANHVVDEKQSALERAIRAGRVRLPAPSCVQAAPTAAPTPGNSAEAQSESDRETLLLIAQIAADGDRAINQLNACIDAYESVRKQLNGTQ